ncbi:D-alanyl-D-alanine carboxypeptidase/D-alanyl-D-alanine endopeptidase [Shewanella donghaensis]|uniref:D-alanyl-D-alanine carboxypeptidase/D-alanyl-D-alanine endopeptidase n=1 Tax=Shewanella donghaensis TaxID=238836 RepID=UPI0011842AD0|nr:D-alanyl-D-alanine carboxypeptidase/D-alanyl-D-alanine-endopeptidase [Shewanella donghaensis]
MPSLITNLNRCLIYSRNRSLVNSLIRIFSICTVSLLSFSSTSVADEYLANMMKIITPPQSQMAINVWDIESNKSIYSLNEDTLLLPASIQKVLTAVGATHQLGTDFYYQTQLLTNGEVVDNTLEGNVYFTFSGDPTFKRKHLSALIATFKEKGIKQISGKIILVGSQIKSVRAPGWAWDDLGICYAAPVSNFIIDRNCVRATLTPLDDSSTTISVLSKYPINITTQARFNPLIKPKQATEHFCSLQMQRFDKNKYQLSGCYPGKKPIRLAIAVNDAPLYASDMIEAMLSEQGIEFTNLQLTDVQLPKDLTLLAEHKSQTLPHLLKRMLEKSDNLIADSLLKKIGQSFFKQHPLTQSVNYDNNGFVIGATALQNILSELNLPFVEANLVDGSGLSRYNLLTSKQMLSVLQLIKIDKQFNYLEDLLPVAGKTGTLKYKDYFKQSPLKNQVSAKTGTMMGVDNLAGFITAENGKQYAFVIIENGLSPKAKKTRLAPFSALFLQTLNDLPQ